MGGMAGKLMSMANATRLVRRPRTSTNLFDVASPVFTYWFAV
jgi:hypothetical protein